MAYQSSITYYETTATTFAHETRDVDMQPLYGSFLRAIPSGGEILDAGCGSGRDAKAFAALGYQVTAFDAAPAMVEIAVEHTGLPVSCLRFDEVPWQLRFDGVWACASLLHVPLADLDAVLQRLATTMKQGGMLYGSFKYGQGEHHRNGRQFTDLDEAGCEALFGASQILTLETMWVTSDRRPGRATERWLNLLARRAV